MGRGSPRKVKSTVMRKGRRYDNLNHQVKVTRGEERG